LFAEPGPFHTILTLLFSLNSCVNPWIYLAFNKELMRALWRVMQCADWGTSRRGGPGGDGDAAAGLNDIRAGLTGGDNGADGGCGGDNGGVCSGSGGSDVGAGGHTPAVSLSVSSGGGQPAHRTLLAELAGSFRRSLSTANSCTATSRNSSTSSQMNGAR